MFGGSWGTSGRWERQDNEGTMLLLLFYVLLAASELRGALLNDSPGALQAHSWPSTLQELLRLRISQLTTGY